jgi:hypothetical protein
MSGFPLLIALLHFGTMLLDGLTKFCTGFLNQNRDLLGLVFMRSLLAYSRSGEEEKPTIVFHWFVVAPAESCLKK